MYDVNGSTRVICWKRASSGDIFGTTAGSSPKSLQDSSMLSRATATTRAPLLIAARLSMEILKPIKILLALVSKRERIDPHTGISRDHTEFMKAVILLAENIVHPRFVDGNERASTLSHLDVMNYLFKQETLNNGTSSCIGCGICVSVCPMDTLSFGNERIENHSDGVKPLM